MNILKSFVILLYLVLYLAIGGGLIALSAGVFTSDQVVEFLQFINSNQNFRLAVGIIGLLFVLVGILTSRISLGKMQREKTIAFENPDGQTARAAGAVMQGLAKAGASVEQVFLPALNLEHCRQCEDGGWGLCREGRCTIDDDFSGVVERMREADA